MTPEVVWNGAMEREWTVQQQRAPEPELRPMAHAGTRRLPESDSVRGKVRRLLQSGGWWTAEDVVGRIGEPGNPTRVALSMLVAMGEVESRYRRRKGSRYEASGESQQYRWSV